MPLTLHAAVVPGMLQMLGAARHLIGQAEAHCAAQGLAPADLLAARLADDMFPLAYQWKSCRVHSHGAIAGLRNRAFSPDLGKPPETFAEATAQIDTGIAALQAITAEELEELADAVVVFTIRDILRMDFTGRDFLLGFSQPNFYFHHTAAYAILRARGVAIGKGDYLGTMPAMA